MDGACFAPGAAIRDYEKWLGGLGATRRRNESSPLVSTPIRDAAAHVASRAQLFYLPVGTKHHFLELDRILSLLQKDLQGPLVRGKGGVP